MQYVRSISGSVSSAWNSINPATLSGAIDVIVIEQADGTLACSPFHVRFGKFSLLRPYEKKVEFRVNGEKQNFALKLGEGGEAFFVFETTHAVPESLQTSPLVSPATSPRSLPEGLAEPASLPEPDYLDLETGTAQKGRTPSDAALEAGVRHLSPDLRATSDLGVPHGDKPAFARSASEEVFTSTIDELQQAPQFLDDLSKYEDGQRGRSQSVRSSSPPPLSAVEAKERAMNLSKKLHGSNIPTHVNESGDLMLDMTGYKSTEADALRAEVIARKILAEELEGNYDIGALIGIDESGNLWIYSSEEAKEAARSKALRMAPNATLTSDAASDPGYHSDSEQSAFGAPQPSRHLRTQSDLGLATPPQSPGHESTNYAKTLRLTSEQLKQLKLKPGANPIAFNVNKAVCTATMWYWTEDVPIVISDIDGTITKSDALGHVLNMIGRDWTHLGVAKLYTEIVSNGYNIMYLTSRSTGQADTTRGYLNGVVQDGYRLPKGPVIMSPDRTIAALRREIYLRKPEVFKMACLRDILNLFPNRKNPFYAGFGNRLTDALSYRSVNIPSSRIFTINSNAEVSLDLLTLSKYKSSYVSIREVVDHFFPPVSMLVTEGGEDFTDFSYWREAPPDLEDLSLTDSEDEDEEEDASIHDDDDEQVDEMGESFFSGRESLDTPFPGGESMMNSIIEDMENSTIIEDDTELSGSEEDDEDNHDGDEEEDEGSEEDDEEGTDGDDDESGDDTEEIAVIQERGRAASVPTKK